jgi:hypothetical protein
MQYDFHLDHSKHCGNVDRHEANDAEKGRRIFDIEPLLAGWRGVDEGRVMWEGILHKETVHVGHAI